MYINKIIELLQKYINDYEAKKYELEVLKTKKQLYEELIPLLENKTEQVKKHIAIEIILNMVLGKSSKLYKELYDEVLAIVKLYYGE